MQSFLDTQITTFHAITELKSLYPCQSKIFGLILIQLNEIHTSRFSFFYINVILLNSSTSFLSLFLRSMSHAPLHFFMFQFSSTSLLLFCGFDTISENCYCSQTLYTGRVKSPCAADQEGCSTVLK